MSATTTKRVEVFVALEDEMEQIIGCSTFTSAANKDLRKVLRCDLSGMPLPKYHPRCAYWADNKVYLVDAESKAHFKKAFPTWSTPTAAQLLEHLGARFMPLNKYKLVAPAPQPSKPRKAHHNRGPNLRPSLAMHR